MNIQRREPEWPPRQAPSDREILASWHMLHVDTLAFLRRHIVNGDVRAFLKTLEPRLLSVTIVSEAERSREVLSDVSGEQDDARPSFSVSEPVEEDEQWECGIEEVRDDADEADNDDADNEPGGAAIIDQDPAYDAETRFCVAMEYSSRTVNIDHPHFAISDYTFRRLPIHPEAALQLISNLQGGVRREKKKKSPMKEHRRVIADALLFSFMEKTAQESAEEEYDDGGVIPTWRNRETDPSLDVLTLCPHLRELYMQICGFDDYME